MPTPFLDIEDKQDSAAQVAALAGVPSQFKYTAAEWNLMRDKINELNEMLAGSDLEISFNNNILPQFHDFGFVSLPAGGMAALVNALPNFDVTGNDEFYFSFKEKIISSAGSGIGYSDGNGNFAYFDIVTKYYKFRRGKGNYGQNGTTQVSNSDFRFWITHSTQTFQPVTFSLGEIDQTPVQTIVDGHGPFGVSEGTTVIFKCKRDGADFLYLWNGSAATVGTGYPPTSASDFVLLNDVNAQPPGSSGYVTHSFLESTFYDTYHSLDGNTLEDVIPSMSEKFYILEIFGTEKFYFASKIDNIEDFENSRIYLSGNGEKYDLGEPTSTDENYNYWDLGEIANNPTSVEPQAFKFTVRKSGGGTLTETIPVTNEVGGFSPGETAAEGTPNTAMWKKLLQSIFNPTYQEPTANLTDNASNLQKIGETIDFTLTMNLNRGAILGKVVGGIWQPNTFQDYRSGAATSYTINGAPAQEENSLLVENYEVLQGDNEFSASVSYAIGPQPKDSAGANFETPLIAGTLNDTTKFEGVHPLFATTATITTATEQALISMITGNNIELELAAESGGDKQFFDIPVAWLTDRPLEKVEFFNPVSGSFDPTDQTATFTVTNVQHSGVAYKRYTNNGSDRGEILIRLKF